MEKKRIITAFVMLVIYFLIHILFIKDGTLMIVGLIVIVIHAIFKMKYTGWFAVGAYPLGYIIGIWCDIPSNIGTLPNNLYVIWLFVFLGTIFAGIAVDIHLKMKVRKEE